MTVDKEHTEIFDQKHQMCAEGTSIGSGGLEPKEVDIQKLLGNEGWLADDEIDIWFDNLQKFWRWSCKIIKKL